MKRCIIVGAGDFTPFTPVEGDLVIAADGGYDSLLCAGVRPALLIGDFDSLSHELPSDIEILRHPVRKDETDTFLAYAEGVRRGCTDFLIIGGTGGRPDHTYANYSLLFHAARAGKRVLMLDGKYAYTAVCNGEIKLDLSDMAPKYVSVFAIGGEASGVCISGLEYEVKGVVLDESFPLGVSNKSRGEEAVISVERGALLVMYER